MPLSINDYETIVNSLPHLTELDLSQYSLTVDDLERIVIKLKDYPQITSLDLKGQQLGDACLVPLARLTALKEVNLQANNISDKGVILLKQLSVLESVNLNFNAIGDEGVLHLTQLKQLNRLSMNGNLITNKGVSHFSIADNLRVLSLINNQLNSFGVKLLSNCPQIESLCLDNNLIDDEGVAQLSQLSNLHVLSVSHNRVSSKGATLLGQNFQGHSLTLNNNPLDDGDITALANNPWIKHLAISKCQLPDSAVLAFRHNAVLTYLDLSYNQLSDVAVIHLAGNKHFQMLNLTRNYLTKIGVQALANNTQFTTLVLKYNRLDDEAIKCFANNTMLESLDLTGNAIGDQGAMALSKMTHLKKIVLNYNNVGDIGAAALAKMPALRHLYLSYNQTANGASAFLEAENLESLYLNYNHISSELRAKLLASFATRILACSSEQPPDFTKENLSNIFLVSKGFFCIISQHGNIQFFNSYFSNDLGYDSEELLAKPLINFIHPKDHGLVNLLYAKKVSEDVILNFITKNGDFLIIICCFQWQDNRLYLTGSDLSFQKKSEKALSTLLQEEIDQAKIFAKQQSNFIAHLCHEIRNPVSAVLSNADVIFEHVKLLNRAIKVMSQCTLATPEQVAAFEQLKQQSTAMGSALADIKVCCRYAEGVLNDNLDASKMDAKKLQLNKQIVNIKKIIEDVVLMSQSTGLKKQLLLQVVCEPSEEWWVKADEMRLKQIIVNLVNNAIKFTKEGQVTISLLLQSQTATQNSFAITVKDTGIGLLAVEMSRLFDRYAQANLSIGSHYGGSGIGLYIAKQLAELMGGTLTVRSKPGQGSEFTCVFLADRLSPEDKMTRQHHSPLISASASAPSTSYRILIVEDNTINSKALSFLLKQMGHRCTIVEDGRQAVAIYCGDHDENHRVFDVILMDTFMPVMDGLTATKTIRQFETEHGLSRKPIITLSGNAQESDKTLAYEAGSDAYLTKPFKKEEVCGTIERVVGRMLISPALASATPVSGPVPLPLPPSPLSLMSKPQL